MAYRGLRLPDNVKERLEQAQKVRGYSSANAFIVEAIEEKLQRMDAVESVSESEARIAADFSRIMREVRSVHTTQQAQYALLDALTKYVSTCIVEPPPDVLASARARGKLRYEKLLRQAARTITGEVENSLLESVASGD
jgi:predicted DNA-binding protein